MANFAAPNAGLRYRKRNSVPKNRSFKKLKSPVRSQKIATAKNVALSANGDTGLFRADFNFPTIFNLSSYYLISQLVQNHLLDQSFNRASSIFRVKSILGNIFFGRCIYDNFDPSFLETLCQLL